MWQFYSGLCKELSLALFMAQKYLVSVVLIMLYDYNELRGHLLYFLGWSLFDMTSWFGLEPVQKIAIARVVWIWSSSSHSSLLRNAYLSSHCSLPWNFLWFCALYFKFKHCQKIKIFLMKLDQLGLKLVWEIGREIGRREL